MVVGGGDGAMFAQQDAETWVRGARTHGYPGDPAGVTYTIRIGHAWQVHPAEQRVGGSEARGRVLCLQGNRIESNDTRVTGGFLYKLGGISYTIRILMYPACILYLACIHQDTSRYIKIQQDTFVSVTLMAIKENVSYLGICILLYDTFRIHLRYIVS